ncbi:ribose 5-phosphate isomerase B [Chitinivibrio alkaliphilus]|uniref:Ribose 5-phosphate isomerase n=1 Tax=Chitinivibrio alkaliphilus ACht1 TaxID=1313304 RepID=U7D7G7_9BACT|nr:ribose 5-phosphate isomerase B [Chitinivibrio alkaliphilus]ERP31873.1 ribose 5-phosphate isomerase [Chitinivibrio alkaliphilus ACht1]
MFTQSIIIGSDHGGYTLKESVKDHLLQKGLTVTDAGTHSEASVDYPVYAQKVARAVAAGEYGAGIVICGTGIGVSIAANRFAGIRASLCHSTEYARLTRLHNNSNILALGGRFLTEEEGRAIVDTWLETSYEGGRHDQRLAYLDRDCTDTE